MNLNPELVAKLDSLCAVFYYAWEPELGTEAQLVKNPVVESGPYESFISTLNIDPYDPTQQFTNGRELPMLTRDELEQLITQLDISYYIKARRLEEGINWGCIPPSLEQEHAELEHAFALALLEQKRRGIWSSNDNSAEY